jgi:FixJ family two-component response regulator
MDVSAEILISIVEDDESMRSALGRLVRSLGYRASGHGSAEAFLASDEISKTRCIITDIRLPGLSGIELKGRLDAAGVTVPVIMVTATQDDALFEKARVSGAFCLLRKPFASAQMISCIEGALAR